jgi:hypothetical protein
MARRALMVAAGVLLAGAASVGTAEAQPFTAGSFDPGSSGTASFGTASFGTAPLSDSPPVATSPAVPTTATVTGAPVNGVQVSATAPQQLPLSSGPPATPLAPREVDVTVKDVGGAGYTGTVSTVFSEEKAGGPAGLGAVGLERFDPVAGAWTKVAAPTGTQTTSQDEVPVTVAAGGQTVERYRADVGIAPFDDLKAVASVNGASVAAVVPVTEPTLEVAGLPAGVKAGIPVLITGKLTNITDVDYTGIDFHLNVAGCDPTLQTCVKAKDVRLEVQTAGVWKPVTVVDNQNSVTGYPLKGAVLPHGAVLSVPMRLTLAVSVPAVNPLTLAAAPDYFAFSGRGDGTATLTPAPVPATATRTTPATTPSASQPSTTDSSQPSAAPSTSDSPTPTPPPSPSASPTDSAVPAAASTPAASGSSTNATVLLAIGLLVLCGGLVGGYFYLQRRGQV